MPFWTRSARRPDRARLAPRVDDLESRQLLTTTPPAAFVTDRSAFDLADKLIGASATRAKYQIDGAGMTAAVIDTGVDYNHPALGGSLGPGSKVKFGYDFGDNDPDPMPTIQHGTSVAGLIASQDLDHPGIAPEAGIVALKVFDNSGVSDFSNVSNALQWVIDHGAEQGVSVVNLSIADGGSYKTNFFALQAGSGSAINRQIAQLAAMNIPVVVATGNSFDGTQGVAFPAIVGKSVSVTGADLTDTLLPDAQRLGSAVGGTSATDLVAPGKGLIAPTVGRDFSPVEGTSFAAAEVSGSIILLQQIYKARFGALPAYNDLMGWLQQGARPIKDAVTGITIGRIDVAKSASLVPGSTTSQPASDTLANGNPTRTPLPQVVVPATPASPANPTAGSNPTTATPPAPTPAPAPVPTAPVVLANIFFNGQALAPVTEQQASSIFGGLIAQMSQSGTSIHIQTFDASSTNDPNATAPTTTPTASTPTSANPGTTSPASAFYLQVWNAGTTSPASMTTAGTPMIASSKPHPSHRPFRSFHHNRTRTGRRP